MKKSLKIPKGQSETVYRRRTDNTMATRKSTKGQITIYNHTYKIKDRLTRTPLKTGGELRWSGRVSSSCSTSGTRHFNLVMKVFSETYRAHYIRYLRFYLTIYSTSCLSSSCVLCVQEAVVVVTNQTNQSCVFNIVYVPGVSILDCPLGFL